MKDEEESLKYVRQSVLSRNVRGGPWDVKEVDVFGGKMPVWLKSSEQRRKWKEMRWEDCQELGGAGCCQPGEGFILQIGVWILLCAQQQSNGYCKGNRLKQGHSGSRERSKEVVWSRQEMRGLEPYRVALGLL